MKRRTYLQTMLAAGAASAAAQAADPALPIQLHVDMIVDPAKEKEMLKLRSTLMGKAPAGVNYRFALTFQSEELRQKWIASDVHQKVWPTIENTLSTKNYTVMLFDVS